MTKQEFERMIDEKLATEKKELMKTYLNSSYGIKANEYPRCNSIYFYIDVRGHIGRAYWTDTIVDKERFDIGNYFETKEDADFEVERLKVIAELKRFADPKDRAWDTNNVHWSINYDYVEESIVFHFSQCDKKSTLYFLSRQEAEKAVEFVGENRVKNII